MDEVSGGPPLEVFARRTADAKMKLPQNERFTIPPSLQTCHHPKSSSRFLAKLGMTLVLFIQDVLVAADAERVCHFVDVIEPRGDERDLQNAFVVKTCGPQRL